MSLDPQTEDHAFDSVSDRCRRCGMTREYYEGHGMPGCAGEDEGPDDRPDLPEDDPLPNAL